MFNLILALIIFGVHALTAMESKKNEIIIDESSTSSTLVIDITATPDNFVSDTDEDSEKLCKRALSLMFKNHDDTACTAIAPHLLKRIEAAKKSKEDKRKSQQKNLDLQKLISDTVVDVLHTYENKLEEKKTEVVVLELKAKENRTKMVIAAASNILTAAITSTVFVIIYLNNG